jgi:hypothetical protein
MPDATPVLTDEIRRLLAGVAVPTVVSILYRKGLRGMMMQAPKPLNPAATKFVGTAFTVRTIPVREDLVEATAAASGRTCRARRWPASQRAMCSSSLWKARRARPSWATS